MNIVGKAATYLRLGTINVIRFLIYRIFCKSGIYEKKLPIESSYSGPFWIWKILPNKSSFFTGDHWNKMGSRIISGEFLFYSHQWRQVGFPPFQVQNGVCNHWSRYNEFNLPGGDIKDLWETSRFDGLLTLVLAWLSSNDDRFSSAMENWMTSWVINNPANAGIQWKCGQETGIRLMNVLLVSELLHMHAGITHTRSLERFILEHCRRIEPTMLYAVAQDNNHGTSEAAALYMAGTWLLLRGTHFREGRGWQEKGRYWLVNRVQRLIMDDGSFSQHSINYHRLMLDTITMVEWWRQHMEDKRFSDAWYLKALRALEWLDAMTDEISGDCPNLGANDGSRIFVMHGHPYRDFRPSVHLASAIFKRKLRYPSESLNESLQWLKYESNELQEDQKTKTCIFTDGGYARIELNKDTWGLLRLPTYRFRPSHADALHFDVWNKGINWVRDGGSFSYNTTDAWLKYFPGTESHATIQFDERDQMPRLSRFLFGNWLQCNEYIHDKEHPKMVRAGYEDAHNARHVRTIHAGDASFTITDEISGFKNKAILRWRLRPVKWGIKEQTLRTKHCEICVYADVPVIRAEIVDGHESLYYNELSVLPVFEVEVAASPAILTTKIIFRDN